MKIEDIKGKTIQSAEIIRAEYGRTYNHYICIVFTDESKIMIAGDDAPWNPDPEIEQMKKAPLFFTPDDIAEKVRYIEQEKRDRLKEEHKRKLDKFNELKKELGINDTRN
jgi:nitrate reductase alpha subunit